MSDAKEWVKVAEADIIKGRYFKHLESSKHTMSELFDEYLTWSKFKQKRDKQNQIRLLQFWRGKIGDKLVCDVDSVLIGDIRNELSAEDANGKARAPATVNRYLALLSHVFTYAVKERKWAESNPCKDVSRDSEDNERVRFLSEGEKESLLAACKELDSTLYLIVVLAISTGARRGEIAGNRDDEKKAGNQGNYCGLSWQDINWKQDHATLKKTKNKDTRSVPISGLAMELLKEHRKIRRMDSDLVFPDPRDPTMPWNFESLWRKAVNQAEITDFHFHDLRHTFATYCLASGATLAELMLLMGHKSPSMVARYAHMEKSHASSIVERMNAKMIGG
jgi:integrase